MTRGATEAVGVLARFRFRNTETGFAVVRFDQDSGGPLTAVGQLAQLSEGQRVKITGTLTEHPRFGVQMEVDAAEAVVPSTVEGIRAYLSSSLIKGIGPAIAERITDCFGDETLRVIEEQPERLNEVTGLGAKRIDELVEAVHAQKDVQDVMVFLRSHGLGQGLAARIVKRYGRGASALIQANPYRLADDVIGIGFVTADRLGAKLGIAPDAPDRIQAGVLHTLGVAARDGHCFLPQTELDQRTAELLGCDAGAAVAQLEPLAAENKVVLERATKSGAQRAIYPLALHRAEAGAARRLDDLLQHSGPPLPVRADEALTWFEQHGGLELPRGQRQALARALREPVSVITGGPGVGKTTIIRGLTEVLAKHGLDVLLAAPTGRAAKRLEESTGRAASTIHRLLEFQPHNSKFLRDDRTPLAGHLLVIDEASMLDITLAYNLLRAIPQHMKLVLVGDENQLPAVGAGNVLADVIRSGRVAVTALTEIFRQQQDSQIVRCAHGMLRGEVPTSGAEGSDFFFIEARNSAHAREIVREVVVHRAPNAFGLDPLEDVQVLCPMYRGDAGADALNRELQRALNPDNPETERGGHRYRVGDKVMQTRNDYDLDVFNGDLGRIIQLDTGAKQLRVRFGDRVVEYALSDLDQLVPAYAISVHRSQGSEYPAVVVPVVTDHYMMLRRSLLYTAITRGKRLVVLIGSAKALEMAVNNCDETERHSGLAARLQTSAVDPAPTVG